MDSDTVSNTVNPCQLDIEDACPYIHQHHSPCGFDRRAQGSFGSLCFFYRPTVRTIVYVDGFNLYYGAVKGTPYKWLDLGALFRSLLSAQNHITAIRYYTAIVSPRPNDPSIPIRQMAYLNAIKAYQ